MENTLMKIKIISDGSYHNTAVIDAETGKMLPVTGFAINVGRGMGCSFIEATIRLARIQIEYTGEAKIQMPEAL